MSFGTNDGPVGVLPEEQASAQVLAGFFQPAETTGWLECLEFVWNALSLRLSGHVFSGSSHPGRAIAGAAPETPPKFEALDLESASGRYHTVTCLDVMIHYPQVGFGLG